jgi:hypothetical protein
MDYNRFDVQKFTNSIISLQRELLRIELEGDHQAAKALREESINEFNSNINIQTALSNIQNH